MYIQIFTTRNTAVSEALSSVFIPKALNNLQDLEILNTSDNYFHSPSL